MGIDVYTAGLALHIRNLTKSTASRVRSSHHPLTLEGIKAARRGVDGHDANVGALSAVAVARRLAALAEGTVIGLPFGGQLGPGMSQDVDRLDAAWWERLPRILDAIERGGRFNDAIAHAVADRDSSSGGFLRDRWDGLPGVSFARAVTVCNSIVLPSEKSIAFAVGTAAIVSTAEALDFLDAAVDRLGVDRGQLEVDFDPALSQDRNDLLYNLRLLHFHVSQANGSRCALGIWG
jgi:hypothetical protein